MTIAIVSSQGLGAYDADRDNMTPVQLFKEAQNGNQSVCRLLGGFPDFVVDITTDTDTSNLQAVDLTDEGVLFPADSIRTIRGKSYCSTDNDHYFYEWEEDVLGGTTPVLMGQRIIRGTSDEAGTVSSYGDVHFKATLSSVATPVVNYASNGLAIAAITSGAADFTVPPNRLCLVKCATLSGSLATSTASAIQVSVNTANLDGAGSGTDAIQFFKETTINTVAADNPIAGADHVLELAFEIWPAHNHRLVMNSNNVEVQCTAVAAIADEVLRHRVEIFVGPLQTLQHHS